MNTALIDSPCALDRPEGACLALFRSPSVVRQFALYLRGACADGARKLTEYSTEQRESALADLGQMSYRAVSAKHGIPLGMLAKWRKQT